MSNLDETMEVVTRMKSHSRITEELAQVHERVAAVRFINANTADLEEGAGPRASGLPGHQGAPSTSGASFTKRKMKSMDGAVHQSSGSKSWHDFRSFFDHSSSLYKDETEDLQESIFTKFKYQSKGIAITVYKDWWVVIAPLIVLGLCTGLGAWGVLAASNQQTISYKADVDKAAQTTIYSITNAIAQSYAPATLLRDVVAKYPDWIQLQANFPDLAADLLTFNGARDTTGLELNPFGRLMIDYPANQNPLPWGWDFFNRTTDPIRAPVMFYTVMNPDVVLLTGPYYIYSVEGSNAVDPVAAMTFTPLPLLTSIQLRTISTVMVKNVDANETFNIPFASATDCYGYPCYNPATRTKYWGSVSCVVNFLSMIKTHGWTKLDTDQGYDFVLSRFDPYVNLTVTLLTSQSLPKKAILYDVPTAGGVWTLAISRHEGWDPVWKWPLVAAVCVLSFFLSMLLFLVLVKQRQHTRLLASIVPSQVIPYLEAGMTYAKSFENVTVLFTDIVGYTNLSSGLTAEQVADLLNEIYALYDELCEQHGMRRIDIIGDAYLAVAGCPIKDDRVVNSVRAVRMAQAMIDVTKMYVSKTGVNIMIRAGLHSGPVVATVIGGAVNPKFTLLGDAVNTASRMESNSVPMRIHISEDTAQLITLSGIDVKLENRGETEIKGKGKMQTYFVER